MSSTTTTTLAAARAALERGIEDRYHRGAVLAVSRNGELAHVVAVGDARDGVPMAGETIVPWFSCTKAVTSLAVLQLWDRGRLDLDRRIASVIPEFGSHGKAAVTVRHLLTHTGGFPTAGEEGGPKVWTWANALRVVCDAPIEPGWVPGERAAYHPQSAFHVLGEVVQRIDGRAFADYVAEEIFEPLDMADSWLALDADRYSAYGDRMGWMWDTSGSEPALVERLARAEGYAEVWPSGSGVGPATDLVKLFEALLGGGERAGERVVSTQAAEAMTARHRTGLLDETFGRVIDWGLGVMVNSWHYRQRPAPYGYGDHASRRAFGHGGSQSSVAFADPAHGLAAVLVCNGRPGEARHHRRSQPVLTALYEDLGLAR